MILKRPTHTAPVSRVLPRSGCGTWKRTSLQLLWSECLKINVAQLLRSTRLVQTLLKSCRQLARVQGDEQRLRQQAEAAGAQTAAARSENQQQAHQLEHNRSEISSIQVSLGAVVSLSIGGFFVSECHIKVCSCARGDWMQP